VAQREESRHTGGVKIFLYYIGRARSAEANRIAADFVERIGHYAHCEMREVRPERFDPWERHAPARKIVLDPAGRAMDSREFTRLVEKAEMDGRDLLFLVGGADGLAPTWRTRADVLVSLSRMTLPHELARAVLAEQIYRAFATLRGHPYPR
jgi:23S rRNA (pseudouridine1915-N3)-methyltransferase